MRQRISHLLVVVGLGLVLACCTKSRASSHQPIPPQNGFTYQLFGAQKHESGGAFFGVKEGFCKINLRVVSADASVDYTEMIARMNPRMDVSQVHHLINYDLEPHFSLKVNQQQFDCAHYQVESLVSNADGQRIVLWFNVNDLVANGATTPTEATLQFNDPVFNHQMASLPLLISAAKI
ncbi:MAG: hypothetical protein AAFZ63_06660 [Bacteroidota bacterium]